MTRSQPKATDVRAPGAARRAVAVRRAAPGDGPGFLALVEALARYEKLEPPTADARARLLEDAFGTPERAPRFTLLVAEAPNGARDPARQAPLAGYAILLETYSSFLARPTLYLEDIFVDSGARERGVGKALMAAVAREAIARGCHRIEGVVLAWNEPAHAFYRRTGATVMNDWWLLRYDRDAMEKLAREK